MRRPRRLTPGSYWFVSTRCARAEFRLRPDPQRKELVGYYLGRSLYTHDGIRIFAFVQMSNHLHMVLEDRDGSLDRFMCQFLGPLAKSINRLDNVSGQVFERRYSASPILDNDALIDRIAYTLLNPLAANLVSTIEAWPGLCLGNPRDKKESHVFTHFHSGSYHYARKTLGRKVSKKDYTHSYEVKCAPINDVAKLLQTLNDKLEKLRQEKRSTPLGSAQVLKQSPFDSPKKPKRSPLPLCHASSLEGWMKFRKEWQHFVAWFRHASAKFRAGDLTATFPPHCFRPAMRVT